MWTETNLVKGEVVSVEVAKGERKEGVIETWSMYNVSREVTSICVTWFKADGKLGKRFAWCAPDCVQATGKPRYNLFNETRIG